jgi:enoyl-CoA hydratase
MRRDPEARKSLVLAGLEVALKIFESPIPVVVGCTGHAIAAGTLLLLGADHVVIGDGPVKIGFNETTIGIELSPFVLELARYRLLPSAYNQILQGTLYGAEAAESAGYVDEVVTASDLLPRATEVANQMAGLHPASYRLTKKAMRSSTGATLRSALERKRAE